jgi:hypothetical protein
VIGPTVPHHHVIVIASADAPGACHLTAAIGTEIVASLVPHLAGRRVARLPIDYYLE